jgi:lipopolysaccharide assembly outer membrane protein LptD (OstA)
VKIGTGPVEVKVAGKDGSPAFVVRAQSSEIEVEKGGSQSGLERVDGEIFQQGKVAARFSASRGQVDQASRSLLATGSVVVRDTKRGIALRADRVRYREGEAKLVASGRVTVSSESWRIGPFDQLAATPDLSRVGTPDRMR